MATTNVPVMAKRVKGGSFLTEEREPQDVFTPEDLSEEHRQIAKTAIDFTQNEVMPAAAEIEAENFSPSTLANTVNTSAKPLLVIHIFSPLRT